MILFLSNIQIFKIKIVVKRLLYPFFLFLFYMIPESALAGDESMEPFSWHILIIGVFGGLAFFLYGLEKMSDGMKKTAGDGIRSALSMLTRNRIVGFATGAFVTMIIQSSSATTVMLVSFVQAGLLSFVQTLGVILGADVGTTITAQLIAFKLTDYALLLVAAGFSLRITGKKEKTKNIGDVILGFGILFFGMKLMSDSMKPLRTYDVFIDAMRNLEHPVVGVLVGAFFTSVVQSSSATTGVIIVLAEQGLMSLEAGIPVIFGANIGTCVTAGIASIGADREAVRVAAAHVLFKLAGVLLFIFWIPFFAELIRELAGRFESGVGRQIANAHTLFNVSVGLIFLPLTPVFSRFIIWLIPDSKLGQAETLSTRFLDENVIGTPALAIDLAQAEISRMAKILSRMLRAVIIPFVSDEVHIRKGDHDSMEKRLLLHEIPSRDEFMPDLTLLEALDIREEKIDFLEKNISEYLTTIARGDITETQAEEIFGMSSIVKDMESIGDLIHRNMVPLIARKKDLEFDFSDEGKEELMIYQSKVIKQLMLLQEAFMETRPELASKIMKKERKYLDLELQYRVRHLKRIVLQNEQSMGTHRVHMELMDLMKQVVVYSSNIAKTFVTSCRERLK